LWNFLSFFLAWTSPDNLISSIAINNSWQWGQQLRHLELCEKMKRVNRSRYRTCKRMNCWSKLWKSGRN
jgi:hypothetical protein